MKNCNAVYCEL